MRSPLDFIDPGASDDEPSKGVLNGHLRDWFDQMQEMGARLREATRIIERSNSDLASLIDAEAVLRAVDYTLTVHGHIDRETPLHDRVTLAISRPHGETT